MSSSSSLSLYQQYHLHNFQQNCFDQNPPICWFCSGTESAQKNTSTDSEDNPYLNQGCNSQFKNTENDALDVQNINDIAEESTEYLREAFGVSTS